MELDTLFSFINTFGVLGLLGVLVWLFLTGKLVPKETMDQRVKDAYEISYKIMYNGLQDAIKKSVKKGFIEAWYELKSSGEKMIIRNDKEK